MKRWLPGLLILALAALVAMPHGAAAQGKDTLTVALPSHAPTLDPHMHFERVGILVNINMFDSLLHRSSKLEFEPSLALSWKALNDTTWEFKLRKGVKFHDGSTMTAEDVKFSFDRVLEPGKEKKASPQYGNIRAIKEVKIVNPDTIHLVTDKPFPLLLERLVFFPIVPKKHVEKVGPEAFGSTATVGTGPWKLVEWKRDQHIRLEAFDQHWRGKPAFKYVVFRAIPEVATQVAELKRTSTPTSCPTSRTIPRPGSAPPRSSACTTSRSTCGPRRSTRRRRDRPRTTPSTSRPSSRR
jgi:peptide/nickel transport system substrate-binding protein